MVEAAGMLCSSRTLQRSTCCQSLTGGGGFMPDSTPNLLPSFSTPFSLSTELVKQRGVRRTFRAAEEEMIFGTFSQPGGSERRTS